MVLSLFLTNLYSDTGKIMFDLYQKGMYTEACNYGSRLFTSNQTNEAFISLLGFSCLKADQIDRLSPMISALSQSPDARANSAYFSLIVMQKKLLMQALYDNKPILNVQFPTSSHLISKVFTLYVKDPKHTILIKEYQDPTNLRQTFKLYTTQLNGLKSIAIDEYYDKILIFHHVY